MAKQETVANILKNIEQNWPESFEQHSPPILRIHRLHDYLQQDLAQVIEQYALQSADFGVLATLRRGGEPFCLSPTELYSSMLLSSGGLTKVLTRVTKAGWVERVDNPEDKRSKLVQLTVAGRVLIDEIIQELHRNNQRKLTALSKEEQQQLDALLAKMLTAWE
ncbi:transcriptional regulator [Photobacterium gaetbulicola]|uniref:MarR family transcriptional regulator n=1 Tax=Photobacterium gaetbulicola Gung47 TaxID=658445 RepID=A0A0C5WU00_9GAMM|nr:MULTISPECIES: MarR family transcriptional regulator [Photobacterium]AJR06530.1 MarR family transcriptional regulator [Photobacterium gaetbulicola Gung47]PSU03551.1 transcriptional regulator [Photobacterium gaetbulicola]WEM44618.1 MarR family transcriptional regulator [Photobacterium sp. DA100]